MPFKVVNKTEKDLGETRAGLPLRASEAELAGRVLTDPVRRAQLTRVRHEPQIAAAAARLARPLRRNGTQLGNQLIASFRSHP